MKAEQRKIVNQLQKQILEMQGFKAAPLNHAQTFGLGSLENCFPNATFPTGTIHEFIAENAEQSAASEGFMVGVLSKLMQNGNACIWIGRNRRLFPPALKAFGVQPTEFIFIDITNPKHLLWAVEEALKCEGLAAVVAEVQELDFAQSRRLQLAVEKSRVTGLLLRKTTSYKGATACTVRWQVKPQPSELQDGMPGVGLPCWQVELLKVRNGETGIFKLMWQNDHFVEIAPAQQTENLYHSKQVNYG